MRGDLACVACSYNLHTLSEYSQCPESSTPILDSLEADRPKGWLRSNPPTRRALPLVVLIIVLCMLTVLPNPNEQISGSGPLSLAALLCAIRMRQTALRWIILALVIGGFAIQAALVVFD